MRIFPRAKAPWILAVLLVLIGLYLFVNGVELAVLGGSLYYALTGFAVAVAGVLLWLGMRLGMWIYVAMLAWTVLWALWEVGLDGWGLAARLIAPFVLGLWFLLPHVRRGWHDRPYGRTGSGFVRRNRLIALVAVAAVIGASALHAADGEWLNFGNDPGGSRHSPLSEITPGNVGKLRRIWSYKLPAVNNPNPKPGSKQLVSFEATPLKIGSDLYFCAPDNVVISLDGDTGKPRWTFDPKLRDWSGFRVSAAWPPIAPRSQAWIVPIASSRSRRTTPVRA